MSVLRIPLSWPYNERGNTTAKDARRINVMDEVSGQTTYTVKRPGYAKVTDAAFPGTGQGLSQFNGNTYYITNDILQVFAGPANSGTDGSAWTANGNAAWGPRWGHQALLLNNTIYIIGGVVGDETIPSSDVWSLGIDTGWKQCTGAAEWGALHSGRYYLSSCVLNGRLFVMGGYDGTNYYNDVWSSDDGTTWTEEVDNAEWAPRFGAVAVTSLNGMYILGGQDSLGNLLNDVWFSADGQTWAQVNDTATFSVRKLFAAYYFNNKLWVVNGSDLAGNGINDVWSSPDGKVWTNVTTTAFALYAAGFCVYGNRMWIANGQSSISSAHNSVYYSLTGSTWTLATASGPLGATTDGVLIGGPTSTAINAHNYQTLYWMGGIFSLAPSNAVYYGNFNAAISAATNLPVTTAGQLYDFASFEGAFLVKNSSDLFVVQSGVVTRVSSSGYPVVTVKGIVVLNRFVYVMDASGLIYNCELDKVFNWPSAGNIGADYEDDVGVTLLKYLNYIVAFGAYTLQIFYDTGAGFNGNPAGSHLAPYLNANMKIGCAAAETVCNVGPNLIWVAQTKECNRQVMMFSGLSPSVISTPFIDKLLKDSDPAEMNATVISVPGHLFYVLVVDNQHPALVYDVSTRNWYEWALSDGSAYHWVDSLALLGAVSSTYVQDPFAGGIYEVTPGAMKDAGTTITATLITGKIDGGNINRKFLDQITVVGDQVASSTATVAYTYDDYQTYSSARNVDMSTNRPIVFQCGQFRRAAFKVVQANDKAMRLEALELEVTQGS